MGINHGRTDQKILGGGRWKISAQVTQLTSSNFPSFYWYQQKFPEYWNNLIKVCPTYIDSNDSGGQLLPCPPLVCLWILLFIMTQSSWMIIFWMRWRCLRKSRKVIRESKIENSGSQKLQIPPLHPIKLWTPSAPYLPHVLIAHSSYFNEVEFISFILNIW